MDETLKAADTHKRTPRPARKDQRELTALDIRRRGPGLHQDGSVAGLYLRVTDSGARGFLLRYMLDGRRRDLWIGSTSEHDLAGARLQARQFRQQIKDGIDPIEQRKDTRLKNRIAQGLAEWTFEKAAREVHKTLLPGWKEGKHADQWINTLTTYAFPKIGTRPVGQIDVAAVVDVLRPIWNTKAETARRVRGRIDAVMRWAVAHQYAAKNPVDDAVELLAEQKDKVEHHAALPYRELPAFLVKLRALDESASRLALELCILTATRSGEIRGATWAELDLPGATWTIAAERMKAGTEHVVPLSAEALAVLKTAGARWGTDPAAPIFPNPAGRGLSDMALTQLVRGMGLSVTVHGFRSTFRDWCAENNVPRDLAERALAHSVRDATEAAYHRSKQIEQRRPLMQDWAVFGNGAAHE